MQSVSPLSLCCRVWLRSTPIIASHSQFQTPKITLYPTAVTTELNSSTSTHTVSHSHPHPPHFTFCSHPHPTNNTHPPHHILAITSSACCQPHPSEAPHLSASMFHQYPYSSNMFRTSSNTTAYLVLSRHHGAQHLTHTRPDTVDTLAQPSQTRTGDSGTCGTLLHTGDT